MVKAGRSRGGTQEPKKGGHSIPEEEDEEWVPEADVPTNIEVTAEFAEELGITVDELKKCKESFQKADADGSGYINYEELKRCLQECYEQPLHEEDLEKLINQYDKDGTGSLCFNEFVQVFCNTPLHKANHLEAMISKMGKDIKNDMLNHGTPTEEAVLAGETLLGSVKEYLSEEVDQMQACLQMPFAVIILLGFITSVMVHERVEEIHAVDKAVTWDVVENANYAFSGNTPFESGRMGHKSVLSVRNTADFWSWFNLGLVPLFWPEGWDVSEARSNVQAMCSTPKEALESFGWNATSLAGMSPGTARIGGVCPEGPDSPTLPEEFFGTPHTPTYLLYHTIVGGIRLRQERVEEVHCNEAESLRGKLFNGPCIASSGYWLDPELRASLASIPSRVDRPGAEDVFLLSNTPQSEIREKLRELENRKWFSPYTGKIEIIYTTYNAHMDVFTATYIMYFSNLGGHVYRRIQPLSFPLTPYHNIWCYLADAIWLIMILKIVIEESHEMYAHVKHFGLKKGNKLYWQLDNFVDWINVFYFAYIAFLWTNHVLKVAQLKDILKLTEMGVRGSFPDPNVREEFYNHVSLFVQDLEFRRGVLAIYPFIIISRFFKAFSVQPRLAMVTNTISRASTDLFHFGLVFMCIFLLFTVSATLLFGKDVGEFATLERSMNSCMRCLLGDFNWEEMKETGRLPASIWFWSFTLLVNMVMLNMLLAIVMDIYTEVRGSIGESAETLWSQGSEVWRRYRQKQAGERVGLDYVLECIEPAGRLAAKGDPDPLDNEPITMEEFILMVPGLTYKQAMRILSASEDKRREAMHTSQSISEAIVDIQRIDGRVEQLGEAFQNVTAIGEMSATMQMAISKSVTSSLERRLEQKDSNTSDAFGFGGREMPAILDSVCQKQAALFLDRCDRLERKMEDRAKNIASEIAMLTNMVNPAQAGRPMVQTQQPTMYHQPPPRPAA